jgi:hypothetical protein
MFIFVKFCVPYVELLQHLDSDCGREIVLKVYNYKQEGR